MVLFLSSLKALRARQLSLVILACASLWSGSARADVLFEGYSKVYLDGTHVGYFVQRDEFDPKTQEFITLHYLKTNQLAGNLSESLKARATSKFRPVSYQFTEVVGDRPRTIDAVFKNDIMTAHVNEGGKKNTITKKISKDAFLSSFLAYVMLAGKEGMKKGVNYHYQAIAEEDASVQSGNALIASEETVAGLSAFKVLNTFKGVEFISYVTYKGEVVTTKSPKQKISSELVASAKEATQGLSFNTNTVTQIFGSVPKGLENPITRRAPGPEAAAAPAASVPTNQLPSTPKQKTLEGAPSSPQESIDPKRSGVPGGSGLMIKGSPGPSEN